MRARHYGQIEVKTEVKWPILMREAIDQAEKAGSQHLPGLRQAQAQGQAEAYLRRLGIVSEADIKRELSQSRP